MPWKFAEYVYIIQLWFLKLWYEKAGIIPISWEQKLKRGWQNKSSIFIYSSILNTALLGNNGYKSSPCLQWNGKLTEFYSQFCGMYYRNQTVFVFVLNAKHQFVLTFEGWKISALGELLYT